MAGVMQTAHPHIMKSMWYVEVMWLDKGALRVVNKCNLARLQQNADIQ